MDGMTVGSLRHASWRQDAAMRSVLGRVGLGRWRTAGTVGLTRLEPVSRTFGFDRGKPIDRWYIERFLAAHAADVRGRVLEVAESTYSQWYGDGEVERSDVLHAAPGNPEATIVGDLTTGEGIPEATFDCFVMTQTLPFIYDLTGAVRGAHRLLKPGGVVLATVPGMSQISREDKRDWGDWWRFTSQGTQRLFAEVFGPEGVEVEAHGNVLAACAFLYGLAAEDLTETQLAHRDADYELLTTVRAVKRPSVT
jgi:SAM-dependent methyltransferase